MMNILVTHGSKRGGTAGIADRIADALRETGVTVEVLPAHEVRDLRPYDAVLVGGALYAMRWHGDARDFVIRHAAALRDKPVWFFSSGPLDDSADQVEIPPTSQVQQLMDFVGASGHATFGGRLLPEARGFIASSMARTRAGDWRDTARIGAWARKVARQINARAAAPGPELARRTFKPLPSRLLPVFLCLTAGLSALFGGASLVLRPDGSWIDLPLSVLRRSPFDDFLVPGLLLLVIVGMGNTLAAYLHLMRSDFAVLGSFVGGSALVVWTVVEMILLRSMNGLQVACSLLGVAIIAESIHLLRAMIPPMHVKDGAPA